MLWLGEILETMDAEIAHRHPGGEIAPDEIGRHLGEQNLATVARRHNACPLMQRQAGIAFLRANRCSRMDAHTHANWGVLGPWMTRQPSLGVGRGKHRLRRSAEDHQEGVPLGVDLNASVALEGTPQEHPMGFQEGRVAVTRLEQKACAALDIGEQERHRALGQLTYHVWLTTEFPGGTSPLALATVE
jgi:hypothetical protein